jgi:tetratricopeptide (TPR) repeat protein
MDLSELNDNLLRGIEAHKANRFDEAEKIYNSVVSNYPDNPDANHNLGILYSNLGQFAKALTKLKKAIIAKPNVEQYWISLINLEAHLENIESFNELRLLSYFVGVHFENKSKALSTYLDYTDIKIEHTEPKDLTRDLILSLRNNRYDKIALKISSDILTYFPNSAFLKNIVGVLHADACDFDLAVEFYRAALRICPNAAPILNNMGVALRELNKIPEAIECLKKAILSSQDYLEAHYNLANCLCESGETHSAIEVYRTACDIDPKAPNVHYNFAIALGTIGLTDDAIEHYKKCIALKKAFPEAHYNLANLYFSNGDIKGALLSYRSALQYRPKYLAVWNNLKFAMIAYRYRDEDVHFALKYVEEKSKEDNLIRLIAANKVRIELDLSLTAQRYKSALVDFQNTKAAMIEISDNDRQTKTLKENSNKNVFALIHFGRSGTGLLHSLLDSHPEVSTLPSIYLSRFFDESTWGEISGSGWEKILGKFIEKFDYLFDAHSTAPFLERNLNEIRGIGLREGLTSLGEAKNQTLFIDRELFFRYAKEEIRKIGFINPRILFETVHRAFDKLNGDKKSKDIIFYHLHNPDTFTCLNYVTEVPDTKFILMVREPIQSCESWCKSDFKARDYPGIVNKIVTMLTTFDNPIFTDHRCLVIKLEDLKLNPEKTLTNLVKKMGIEFNDSLYEMTMFGKKWWGDPTSPDYQTDGMEPFSLAPILREVGEFFSLKDQEKLKFLFFPMREFCGYLDQREKLKINPQIDQVEKCIEELFDFEVDLMRGLGLTELEFKSQGSFWYLRSVMKSMCCTLGKHSKHRYNFMTLV